MNELMHRQIEQYCEDQSMSNIFKLYEDQIHKLIVENEYLSKRNIELESNENIIVNNNTHKIISNINDHENYLSNLRNTNNKLLYPNKSENNYIFSKNNHNVKDKNISLSNDYEDFKENALDGSIYQNIHSNDDNLDHNVANGIEYYKRITNLLRYKLKKSGNERLLLKSQVNDLLKLQRQISLTTKHSEDLNRRMKVIHYENTKLKHMLNKVNNEFMELNREFNALKDENKRLTESDVNLREERTRILNVSIFYN